MNGQNGHHEIKLRQFMEEELDAVLKRNQTEKLQALIIYPLMFERHENLTKFFDYAMQSIN